MMSTGNGDGGSSRSTTSGSGERGGNNRGDNNTYVNAFGFGDNSVAHYHQHHHNHNRGGGNAVGNSTNDGREINNNVGGGGRERPLKKGPWTAEEDAILLEYVRKHGEGNWNAVQRNSGLNRCGKSCRLRWANHLRPNLKKGSFTHEEERLIIELHAKMGNKWARMANLLPGRTDNEIKNYWNTRIKRHQRQGLPLYPPNIQTQQQQHFQHDLLHHNQHHQYIHHKSFDTPPSSINTFSFQPYQLPSPTAIAPPNLHPYHHQAFAPHSSASHNAFQALPLFNYSQQQQQQQSYHPDYTPTNPSQSPFTFQTKNLKQNYDHPSSASTTPTHVSPLPSPSVANNSSPVSSSHHQRIPTLALLDFSFPRPTPILQSPNRFKRFASCGDIANSPAVVANQPNNNNAHPHHLPPSLANPSSTPPLPPHPIISSNNVAHMGNSHNLNHPNVLSSLLDGNNSEFHKEIQKENEEMCSLLASMSHHPELPSNQLLSQNPFGVNSSTSIIPQGQFTRSIDMKNRGNNKNNNNIMISKEEGKNDILLAAPTSNNTGNAYGGSLEDLWQEVNPNLMMQRDNYVMQRNDNDVHGYTTTNKNAINFSNYGEQQGDNEELSKFLEESEIRQTDNQFCGENFSGGDKDHQTTSNDPSVVTTEDHINFDLHHMCSFLPTTTTMTTTDPDRPPLETYSWDNLPEIC
ncbi:unnamed protein product [Linum tenue]|uniref:Uncharacterized protein n=1 Tax=Linum tenue TaxID=586396 RepID=A0AAV0H3G9_9ROSI|nr:unnamed protein product [Linum tenue]